MLKGIPKNISPELLKVLNEMGHGDEIVISDGNFPSERLHNKVIRCDSTDVPELLESILKIFPLDSKFSDEQVFLMAVGEGVDYQPNIWDEYEAILEDSDEVFKIKYLERFDFYDRAKDAYAVIHTGETALYANIILKKGVVE